MSMLEEIWTCGLSYKDRPVKLGSALERTLCLYTKNQNKLKAMLSEEQATISKAVAICNMLRCS